MAFEQADKQAYEMFANLESNDPSLVSMATPDYVQAADGGSQAEENEAGNPASADTQTAESNTQNSAQPESGNDISALMKQMQSLVQQNSAIAQQNEELKAIINSMSEAQQLSLIDGATSQTEQPQLPEIDLVGLAYEDEEVARERQKKYAQDMLDFAKKSVMDELSPVLEQFEAQKRSLAREEAIRSISALGELSGFSDMLPQVDSIMASNDIFKNSSAPIVEQMISAFLMAKGAESVNSQNTSSTPEEFMAFYESSPELQQMVEIRRAEKLKPGQQVPPFSANGGAQISVNLQDKPTSLEDAHRAAFEMIKRQGR